MPKTIHSTTTSQIIHNHNHSIDTTGSSITASRKNAPILTQTSPHTAASPTTSQDISSRREDAGNMKGNLSYGDIHPNALHNLSRQDSDNESTLSSDYESDTGLSELTSRDNSPYRSQTPTHSQQISASDSADTSITAPSGEALADLRTAAKTRLPIQRFMSQINHTNSGYNDIKHDPSTELTDKKHKKLAKGYVHHESGVLLKDNKRTNLYPAGDHAWFANEAYLRKPSNFTCPKTQEHFEVKHTSNDSRHQKDGNTWCMWQHKQDDKHKIVVGFQGTNINTPSPSLGDIGRDMQSAWQTKLSGHTEGAKLSEDYPNAKTGYGFMERHSTQIESLRRHIDALDPEGTADIVFSGHSLGASMSQLTGLLYSKENPGKNIKVEAYNCPNTGNKSLQKAYREHLENSSTFSSHTYDIKSDPFSDYVRRPDMHQLDPNTTRMPSRGNIVDNHRMDNWEGTPYRTTP